MGAEKKNIKIPSYALFNNLEKEGGEQFSLISSIMFAFRILK